MPFISTGSGGNKVVPFYGGGQVPNPANVIVLTAAPSSAATGVAVGTIAVNTTASSAYMAVKNTGINGTVTWAAIGGATTDVNTLTPDSGTTPVVPTGGTISLKGTANQITSVGGTNQITFALASALTAPGSVTATTTITATLGDITATNGNFVSSAAGKGVSFNVATGTGAASGTVNCNGRVGSVTFSSVSIAAAADLTLTMGNTSIAGSSTRLLFSMSGATTGAALSIKSVTTSANTCAWVVTNGTGATTTTADITFDFVVLN